MGFVVNAVVYMHGIRFPEKGTVLPNAGAAEGRRQKEMAGRGMAERRSVTRGRLRRKWWRGRDNCWWVQPGGAA